MNVGGLYSLLFPAKMSMTYTEGAATSIEVGASFDGDFGSFSAGGTFTETASAKVHFPPETDETTDNMQTNFTFGRYSECGILNLVLPENFAGGDNEVSLLPPGATICTHYKLERRIDKDDRDSRHVQGRRQLQEGDRHQLVGSVRIQ